MHNRISNGGGNYPDPRPGWAESVLVWGAVTRSPIPHLLFHPRHLIQMRQRSGKPPSPVTPRSHCPGLSFHRSADVSRVDRTKTIPARPGGTRGRPTHIMHCLSPIRDNLVSGKMVDGMRCSNCVPIRAFRHRFEALCLALLSRRK